MTFSVVIPKAEASNLNHKGLAWLQAFIPYFQTSRNHTCRGLWFKLNTTYLRHYKWCILLHIKKNINDKVVYHAACIDIYITAYMYINSHIHSHTPGGNVIGKKILKPQCGSHSHAA